MSDTSQQKPHCIVCKQTSDSVPVLTLHYQDNTLGICPQHLPILIHNPAKLAGILPGAENFASSDHHDH